MKEKFENPRPFPILFDIELTNYCNMNCKFCPVGQEWMMRPQGFMSREVFEKIIKEIVKERSPDQQVGIRFIRWGEPLLHPFLLEFTEYAERQDIICHINTNATLIDSEFISRIVKIPLTSIKFSMQEVTAHGYEYWRGKNFFAELLGWVKELYYRRSHRQFPFIQIGTTVSKNTYDELQIKRFKDYVSQYCDLVTVGRTRNLINDEVVTNYPECPEMFDKLSIDWDGDVTACCADWNKWMVVGNVKEQSLKEIWEGEKLKSYREMLIKKQHNLLPVCKKCIL